MYSYLHFLALLICVHISWGATSERNVSVCAKVDKPGWNIDNLRSVPLNEWPWECLRARYTNDTLRQLASQNCTDIYAAAHEGWIGYVQLYGQKTDFLDGSLNVSNLLRNASTSGNLKLVKYLVEEKRLPINQSDYRLTAEAALNGNLDLVKYIVEEKNVTTNTSEQNNNSTPVHFAAMNKNVEVLRYFVETLHIPFDTINKRNDTPTLLAAWTENVPALRYLIERGANIMVRSNGDRTLLHESAIVGDINACKYLIEERNVSVDPTDAAGWTPAFFAVSGNYPLELQYLVEKGANLYHRTETVDNETMLHVAVMNGMLPMVKYLIEKQNMSVEVEDGLLRTPLHTAARHGHLALVKYLAGERNASRDGVDYFYLNLLHQAAAGRNVTVMRYLVDDMGMSMEYLEDTDVMGLTVAMQAAKYGSVPILRYLIEEKHVNKTAVDLLGRNLLHTAALHFELETIQYLIEKQGFNATERTPKGHTAYDIINRSKQEVVGRNAILDYLKHQKEQKSSTPSRDGH